MKTIAQKKNRKQTIFFVIKVLLAVSVILLTFLEGAGIVHYVSTWTNGIPSPNATEEYFYGWKAVQNDKVAHSLYGPIISIASFLQSIWLFIFLRKKSVMFCLVVSVILFEINLFYWILVL